MSYVTRQRQVLGAVFEQAKRPLTPCEIRDEARKEIPSLGIATVYRAINRLVADGQVRPVEVPGAGPHYERAGPAPPSLFPLPAMQAPLRSDWLRAGCAIARSKRLPRPATRNRPLRRMRLLRRGRRCHPKLNPERAYVEQNHRLRASPRWIGVERFRSRREPSAVEGPLLILPDVRDDPQRRAWPPRNRG